MDAKLVVIGGDAKAAEIPLKLPVIIGRGREASLTLPHPLVSRKHCQLYESDGALMVRDLGSLNGTYINNHRIDEAILPPGELLTLGTVTFRAVYTPAPSQASAVEKTGEPAAVQPSEAAPDSHHDAPDGQPGIFQEADSLTKDAETEAVEDEVKGTLSEPPESGARVIEQ